MSDERKPQEKERHHDRDQHQRDAHRGAPRAATFDGYPDGVSLETLVLTDLGDGRTRATRSCAAAWSRGVVIEGYPKLDALLAGG